MPGPASSCLCEQCPVCRARLRKHSASVPRNEARKRAADIRWGNVSVTVADREHEDLVEQEFVDDGVSDEELDRRALDRWRPEWTRR